MKLAWPIDGVDASDLQGFPAHWIEDTWEPFASTHSRWLSTLDQSKPVYCLPKRVIERLRKGLGTRPAPLDQGAAAAETDLAGICEAANAAGFAGGRYVHYPLLSSSEPTETGFSETPCKPWLRSAPAESIRERLSGYAGRLVIDPTFMAEADALRMRYYQFPVGTRPVLPLGGQILANDYLLFGRAPSQFPLGPRRTEQDFFERDFARFCDRWVLEGMATWELPMPIQPKLHSNFSQFEKVHPPGVLLTAVPFYYPLAADRSLEERILERQKEAARECGAGEDLAALRHFKFFAQILRVSHIERVVLDRYAGRSRWGLARPLEEALSSYLGISTAQVQKLRKAASAFRRGKGESLRWLKGKR